MRLTKDHGVRRRHAILFIATLLFGLVLRLIAISSRPIWYDEAFAILFSEKGISAMLVGTLTPVNGIAADVHPLAYYALLWGWMQCFGQSLVAARALSVLFGTGVIALAYWLGKSSGTRHLGLVAATLTALSPFQIHYAQEIRMYALLAFLLIGATWALWQGMQTMRWYWWAIFALASALAQYTHNLAIFYLLPLAATPLFWRRWKAFLYTLLAAGMATVIYLPWLLQLPGQFARVQSSYWTDQPGVGRVITTLLSFTTSLPLPDAWLAGGLFVTIFVVVIAARQTWRAFRLQISTTQTGLWFLYLAFAPPFLLFMFSQWRPVYIERALLGSGVMFLLWLAWCLSETRLPLPAQGMTGLLLAVAFAAGYYQHLTYQGFPYGPYPQLVQSLENRLGQGDVILHSNKLTMLPAVFYNRNLDQRYIKDPEGSGSDTLALPTQKVLGLCARSNVEDGVDNADRVWFVIFAQAIQEYRLLGLSTHPHLEWLDNHYELSSVETWGDIFLYQYQR